MGYTRKTFAVLILMLSLVISVAPEITGAASSDRMLFSDDFESYSVGSFPSQWSLVFNGMGNQYQRVISDPVNPSNKCFQLQGERNWAADAVRYFQTNADIIGFEVSVLVTANHGSSGDDVKVGLWRQINWGEAAWTDGVAFTDNGNIVARDIIAAEGTGTVLQTYVPGQWYHIRFVLDRPNQVISVFVNGVLRGSEIRGSNSPYVFDGFSVSGRYTEIPVDYDNVKIFEVSSTEGPKPTDTPAPSATPQPTNNPPLSGNLEPYLTLSCSSAGTSDFNVQIRGNLTYEEVGISDAPILLSYSVNEEKSWTDLTTVHTAPDGSYYAAWTPSVTGYYSLKAVYEGNENYSGTEAIVNFAVEPFQEQSVFSVNSNSTLTGLLFNSDSKELSFRVSGEEGTTGYVNVYIPKSLVSDVSALKVYLDDRQIEYSSQSQGDGWLLYFTYHHSSHLVDISLGSSSALSPAAPVLMWGAVEVAILVLMGTLVAVTVVVVVRSLERNKPSKNSAVLQRVCLLGFP